MKSVAAGGVQTATPALDLLDVVSLAEPETHFENAKIVNTEHAKKPADGARQPLSEVTPVVFHPAASPRGHGFRDRAQGRIGRITVSHPAPGPQSATAAYPVT